MRSAVRERYGKIAKGSFESAGAVCCAPHCADDVSQVLGYSSDELADLPEGANLGLGCGNPQRIAELKPGETVLDLGSGGGVDCFLAARQVGPDGLIIGVDMTPDMITKARENARKAGAGNIEFRLGEIEHLPVAEHCGRNHEQLRNQPGAGQARSLQRSVPRAQAWWQAGNLRRAGDR
jgi:SAM-dependent methyltransferase